MASAATIVGVLLIVGLIGIGVSQSFFEDSAGTALAVAAPEPTGPTQQELNLCMNDCMRGCVVAPGDEDACLAQCNQQCGA